jgi:hypothetical protein
MLKIQPRRFAGISDVENILTRSDGRRLPLVESSALIGKIYGLTRGIPMRAAMAEPFLRHYLGPLSITGWGIDTVEPGPDAADRVLLARGREFVADGYTDLVVVSGDWVFSDLGDAARLHVVSLPDRLSLRLRRRACSVTLLEPNLPTFNPPTLAA